MELYRTPSGDAPVSSPTARVALATLIALYIGWFSFHSIDRWTNMQCTWYDFGNIDNACYNTAHDGFMRSNSRMYNYWSDHISPILFVVSAYYLFSDGHWFIFIWQTVCIALAAIPLFLIARHFLKSEWIAFLIAAGYLLNGKVHLANLYDYHMYSHLGLFALSAFYAMIKKRWGWFFFFAALLLSVKEDAFIVLAGLGLYAAVVEREYKWAVATWLVCAVYALVAFKVAFPYMRSGMGEEYEYSNTYLWLGASAKDIVFNFITKPVKMFELLAAEPVRMERWKGMVVQYGFLPFLSPTGFAMLFLPSLELILQYRRTATGIFLHYPLLVVPLWTLASVFAISNIQRFSYRRGLNRLGVTALAAAPALYLLVINVYMAKDYGALPYLSDPYGAISAESREHARKAREALAAIPRWASLAANQGPFTLLNHNPNAYFYWGMDKFPFTEKSIDYIVIDTKDAQKNYQIRFERAVRGLLLDTDYGVVKEADGLYIFKKGADKKEDYRFYTKRFLTRWAVETAKTGGDNVADKTSEHGAVRRGTPGKTGEAVLVFGQYFPLRRGDYTAVFRVKVDEITSATAAVIDVSADKGATILATRELAGADFDEAGRWTNIKLPFKVNAEKGSMVELRVHYKNVTGVSVDLTRVEMPYEAFLDGAL